MQQYLLDFTFHLLLSINFRLHGLQDFSHGDETYIRHKIVMEFTAMNILQAVILYNGIRSGNREKTQDTFAMKKGRFTGFLTQTKPLFLCGVYSTHSIIIIVVKGPTLFQNQILQLYRWLVCVFSIQRHDLICSITGVCHPSFCVNNGYILYR